MLKCWRYLIVEAKDRRADFPLPSLGDPGPWAYWRRKEEKLRQDYINNPVSISPTSLSFRISQSPLGCQHPSPFPISPSTTSGKLSEQMKQWPYYKGWQPHWKGPHWNAWMGNLQKPWPVLKFCLYQPTGRYLFRKISQFSVFGIQLLSLSSLISQLLDW